MRNGIIMRSQDVTSTAHRTRIVIAYRVTMTMRRDESPTVNYKEGNIFLPEKNDNSLGVEADREIFAIPNRAAQNNKMGVSGHNTGDVPKHKNPWK